MREIGEKTCLTEEKLQSGNMYTNNTSRISGNILENHPLETGTTSESINFWENLKTSKGNYSACLWVNYSRPGRV
jgi:hypothetical protein